jgi:membrane-bound serine protease (ClpP class)
MESYLIVAFVLLGLGVVQLIGEFAFPTGGLFLFGALITFAIAVGVVWYHGTSTEATVAVVGFCLGVPAMGWALVQAWKSLAIKRGLDPDAAGGTITQAVPELSELEQLKGQTGKTATPMRPSGVVTFGGQRVDAITEGMMLDPNVWVRCVDVKAGRVIVRRIDTPDDLTDLNPDDFK